MMRALLATAAFGLVLMGYGSDPTTSEECEELEQELADAEQELAALSAPVVTLPDEAVATIEGLRTAHDSYDTDGMRAYLTEDFTFQSYGDVNELDGYPSYIDQYYEAGNFALDATGEGVVTGEDGTYFFAEPGFITGAGIPGLHGFSVYTLIDDDGAWMVRQVCWIGEDLP